MRALHVSRPIGSPKTDAPGRTSSRGRPRVEPRGSSVRRSWLVDRVQPQPGYREHPQRCVLRLLPAGAQPLATSATTLWSSPGTAPRGRSCVALTAGPTAPSTVCLASPPDRARPWATTPAARASVGPWSSPGTATRGRSCLALTAGPTAPSMVCLASPPDRARPWATTAAAPASRPGRVLGRHRLVGRAEPEPSSRTRAPLTRVSCLFGQVVCRPWATPPVAPWSSPGTASPGRSSRARPQGSTVAFPACPVPRPGRVSPSATTATAPAAAAAPKSDTGRVLERHRLVGRRGPEPRRGVPLRRVLCLGQVCARPLATMPASSDLRRTLVESWNGTAWSVVASPSPSVAFLYGVSCPSARSCKAVGEYANNSGAVRTLVESWNGTAWST